MKFLIAICFLTCISCNTQQHATGNEIVGDTFVHTIKDTLEISPFLVDYIGEFTNGKMINAREGSLYYIETIGGKTSALSRIGKDVFHLENNEATIRFFRNNFNQVMAFRMVWVGGKKEFCQRKGPVYMAK